MEIDAARKIERISTRPTKASLFEIIHDYFGVDIEKVWLTVKKDIPELKKQIDRILKTL